MAIVAPLSKYKKTNYKIIIAVLIGISAWFLYDGHYNRGFIEKHTLEDGSPDSTLVSNRKAPPYLIGAAVLVAAYLLAVRNKSIIADEKSLIVGKKVISYDLIEQIDKTYFDSKGWFVVTYKNNSGSEFSLKLSDRTYDNLPAVLDELVRQIS